MKRWLFRARRERRIGCNTVSQPFGHTLVDGFVRELAAAKTPRLGDCWIGALRYYVGQQQPARRLSLEYLNRAPNQVVGKAVDGGFFSDLWKGYVPWGVSRDGEMPCPLSFDPKAKPEAAVMDRAKQQTAGRLLMTWEHAPAHMNDAMWIEPYPR